MALSRIISSRISESNYECIISDILSLVDIDISAEKFSGSLNIERSGFYW